MSPSLNSLVTGEFTRRHHQRLREIYRSAGWPCLDTQEVELLAAGLLARINAPSGHETLRVTDARIEMLARVFAGNRAARSAHEALVEKVALLMGRDGRLVWRGLSLRVQVRGRAPLRMIHCHGALPAPMCPRSAIRLLRRIWRLLCMRSRSAGQTCSAT